MKRIAAILLLIILLFNWVGYEFYTAILQDHADKTMVANLDQNNYTDANLISIFLPMSIQRNFKGLTVRSRSKVYNTIM